MDVFQVLTLCSLLGVMLVSVLGYGTYRNWRRNQLELVHAPSVDLDVADVNDTTERIYPNIRVSSKPKTKNPELQTGIFAGIRPETRAVGETKSVPKRASSSGVARGAVSVEASPSSVNEETDLFSATEQVENSLSHSSKTNQPEGASNALQEAKTNTCVDTSTQVEDDGLSVFSKRTPRAESSRERQNSKSKFLRPKNASRLERKPPQPSKRRKPKSVQSSISATKPSSRNGDARDSEDFVMFFVMGEHDNSFRMNDVGHFLQARDLILDEMGLFCRNDRDTGEVLFKVGDVFHPGSFRVEDLEDYRTGGISLAMKIPNVNNAQVVFEQMLTLANECAERFLGTVKDENYNNMSNQTLAHYRSRVSDFRRKQLTMYA